MKSFIIIFSIFLIFACESEAPKKNRAGKTDGVESLVATPGKKIDLWNGKDFTNWKMFIEDSSVPVEDIWSVKDGAIHCTGAVNGYLRTNTSYRDYKLIVEWRWPEEPGNSGVLLHINGTDMVWPVCIEAQLKTENAGDFYLMGGTSINEQTDKTKRLVQKIAASSENPAGEWNKYEILCSGDTVSLTVNGVLQNKGTGATVQQGTIGFQSEGKPIEFKTITLEPLQ